MEIWFGFSFGALQGKGIDNKINKKKVGWGVELSCSPRKKKRKKNGQIFINSILVEIDFVACQYALQLLPRFKGLI